MAPKITKTIVWAAEVTDQPGGLAEALTALAQAGANLEFIIARRQAEEPGTGVVFVTPLQGRKVLAIAKAAGFAETDRIITLKIAGDDEPGIGARIAEAVATARINLRGFSAAVVDGRFRCYLGFDTSDDAARTSAALREEFRPRPSPDAPAALRSRKTGIALRHEAAAAMVPGSARGDGQCRHRREPSRAD